jgi:hypothetical protein
MPHGLLQPPQLRLSVFESTQVVPQASLLLAQTVPPPALPALFAAPPEERPPEGTYDCSQLVLFAEVPQLAATNKSPAALTKANTERMSLAFA